VTNGLSGDERKRSPASCSTSTSRRTTFPGVVVLAARAAPLRRMATRKMVRAGARQRMTPRRRALGIHRSHTSGTTTTLRGATTKTLSRGLASQPAY